MTRSAFHFSWDRVPSCQDLTSVAKWIVLQSKRQVVSVQEAFSEWCIAYLPCHLRAHKYLCIIAKHVQMLCRCYTERREQGSVSRMRIGPRQKRSYCACYRCALFFFSSYRFAIKKKSSSVTDSCRNLEQDSTWVIAVQRASLFLIASHLCTDSSYTPQWSFNTSGRSTDSLDPPDTRPYCVETSTVTHHDAHLLNPGQPWH